MVNLTGYLKVLKETAKTMLLNSSLKGSGKSNQPSTHQKLPATKTLTTNPIISSQSTTLHPDNKNMWERYAVSSGFYFTGFAGGATTLHPPHTPKILHPLRRFVKRLAPKTFQDFLAWLIGWAIGTISAMLLDSKFLEEVSKPIIWILGG